jgi:hypothetical protein
MLRRFFSEQEFTEFLKHRLHVDPVRVEEILRHLLENNHAILPDIEMESEGLTDWKAAA